MSTNEQTTAGAAKRVVSQQTFKIDGESVILPVIDEKKDVFISYKRVNAGYVERLFNELNEHGIKAWFDLNELHQNVGKRYTNRIHKGIDNSEFFLLIYTKEVENSEFIIKEELGYAAEKNKTILFYPKERIDIKNSALKEFVEKIQWLDTEASAVNQPDTQESIVDEKRLAALSALINVENGKCVFEDQSLFLIRIALQRLLGRITVFGNYKKLCGPDLNEFYHSDNFTLSVLNKALFIDVPLVYRQELTQLKFFRKDDIKTIERHLDQLHPDNEELMSKFRQFLELHADVFSLSAIHKQLERQLLAAPYKSIVLPELTDFGVAQFVEVVASMVASSFISDLKADKTLFNGAELGVYSITDNRIINTEEHCVDIQLYYSDYFTFKCMTEMYHLLCSIDDKPFIINSTQDIQPLAPFLCSLGLGGFIAAYIQGKPSLMWTKRSGNISSGDIWHFSYDETVSLLLDGVKDEKGQLLLDENNVVHIDIRNILFRALKEEVGATQDRIEKYSYGLFEVGIIKSERLEIELISQAVLHLNDDPTPQEQIKEMHDNASDGYLEIAKVQFIPLRQRKELIGRLLTPESYAVYTRMLERLKDNIGRNVKLGRNLLIEEGSFIEDGAEIGDDCRIHRNVHIGTNVKIGKKVKIQNNNSIYEGVELEDGVFIGTNVSFINDRYPRSIKRDGSVVSSGDCKLERTKVCYGASIGAGSVIMCGVTIGRWAMVAAGSVVLTDVPERTMVAGNPARVVKTDIEY